eukprot:1143757-Rhodomonas_salina.2
MQETAISVQLVPGMRFLVFEFAMAGDRDLQKSLSKTRSTPPSYPHRLAQYPHRLAQYQHRLAQYQHRLA